MTRVSVAMCTYNGEPYIGAQLVSILNQSRPPDEVVICDDGSTDDTAGVVVALAGQTDVPVHFIRNDERLGVTANFEQAIARTTGDVIFLSDQDDVWQPERIATMLQPFEADAAVTLVYSDAEVVDDSLKPRDLRMLSYQRLAQVDSTDPFRVIQAEAEVAGALMAFSAAIKPYALPIVNGWFHDHGIALIAHATGHVVRIDRPLMAYRRHANTVSGDSRFNQSIMAHVQQARRVSGRAVAEQSREMWQAMVTRLNSIEGNAPQLNAYRAAASARADLASARALNAGRGLPRRATFAVNRLLRGDYHRFLRGWRSFARDLLLR
ncbi:MAG: glycosyltransferase family 2 protein [Chloroflexota bacterium]